MRKYMCRVGILNPTRTSRSGGGFYYLMSLIEGLRDSTDFEIFVFYDDPTFQKFCFDSPYYKWVLLPEHESLLSKIVRRLSAFMGIRSPLLGRYGVLHDCEIDLLISFESLVGINLNIPFLTFIGDAMYKYYPGLPEYTLKKRVIRDMTARKLLKYSVLTVVDSEKSREDLIRFYGAKAEKIRPIPLCAPPHIYKYRDLEECEIQEVMNKYHLPERFIFYPAQFWHHKNHLRLIQSLALLHKEYGVKIPAVFSGAAWQSFDGVTDLVKELGMGDLIYCPGYLEEREIVALYKKASALVFASFADYTNIPVTEAMVLGTPVLCSNLFAMPEQLGGAGLLFDPFNVEDMAGKIYSIWTDKALRDRLTAKGYQRAVDLSPQNFARRWKNLIEEAAQNKAERPVPRA